MMWHLVSKRHRDQSLRSVHDLVALEYTFLSASSLIVEDLTYTLAKWTQLTGHYCSYNWLLFKKISHLITN